MIECLKQVPAAIGYLQRPVQISPPMPLMAFLVNVIKSLTLHAVSGYEQYDNPKYEIAMALGSTESSSF